MVQFLNAMGSFAVSTGYGIQCARMVGPDSRA